MMEGVLSVSEFLLNSSDVLQVEQNRFLNSFDKRGIASEERFSKTVEVASSCFNQLSHSLVFSGLMELRSAKNTLQEISLESQTHLQQEFRVNENQYRLKQELEDDFREYGRQRELEYGAKKKKLEEKKAAIIDKQQKKSRLVDPTPTKSNVNGSESQKYTTSVLHAKVTDYTYAYRHSADQRTGFARAKETDVKQHVSAQEEFETTEGLEKQVQELEEELRKQELRKRIQELQAKLKD
mmetsp:Transcript_3915/g.4892  ORF Transcript_3915/g.4892 Transcript_3915/m.4892 type:complete len:239 (+) Transcript_3915:2-718(+)